MANEVAVEPTSAERTIKQGEQVMRAAWYERTGDARDVLQVSEIEMPEVKPGEVRVCVHAAGVNPADVKRRSGWGGQTMEYPRIIPGDDGAGVIDAVGEGVPKERVGERVWLWNARVDRAFGTAAEYVIVPEERAVCLPETTSFAQGACLGVPATTAHYCVFCDGPVRGLTVLVTGGAGGVGYYAVQLAKWGGATVITTVGSDEDAAPLREVGADHVLNYKTEDVTARIKEITGEAGVDRIVEVAFAANLDATLALLKENGKIATYASDSDREPRIPFYDLVNKNATIHFVLVYILPTNARQQAIADLTTCLATGALKHTIGQRFPLSEIAAAHEAVERGQSKGKVILEIA